VLNGDLALLVYFIIAMLIFPGKSQDINQLASVMALTLQLPCPGVQVDCLFFY